MGSQTSRKLPKKGGGGGGCTPRNPYPPYPRYGFRSLCPKPGV